MSGLVTAIAWALALSTGWALTHPWLSVPAALIAIGGAGLAIAAPFMSDEAMATRREYTITEVSDFIAMCARDDGWRDPGPLTIPLPGHVLTQLSLDVPGPPQGAPAGDGPARGNAPGPVSHESAPPSAAPGPGDPLDGLWELLGDVRQAGGA